jgi:uncharacterized secreted protein with C-terminal beta-propeller domain
MSVRNKGSALMVLFFVVVVVLASGFLSYVYLQGGPGGKVSLEKFDSCDSLAKAFKQAYEQARAGGFYGVLKGFGVGVPMPMMAMTEGAAPSYSTTNIQVAGVDEADIVKTDGEYIYTLSMGNLEAGDNKLIIAKAYPSEDADILSKTELKDFFPKEMFVHGDVLLIFGAGRSEVPITGSKKTTGKIASEVVPPYPYYISLTTVQLWDITDRANPKLTKSIDFEGTYLSSRKIGPNVYFVVNSYPRYRILENGSAEDIIPKYRERTSEEIESKGVEFAPACRCVDVEYFEPINPERFVTVASIRMDDIDADIKKEVIVGSGQNIYASLQNLYIAESSYPFWRRPIGGDSNEKTFVHKFSLDGEISYIGHMEAPGRVLNQFSMDEYNNYFRIATTTGHVSRIGGGSTNNVYIFDEDLNLVGKLEDLAPGERIYSARFMEDRGYLVTFKKVDPLFAIDLSNPENPRVLGKLKIPGYSDYLHPYDENHLIGIGKETVEAEEGDFAWYQGVKLAIFDVTDVENPKQLHKVVIGDRGTDSYVLRDHKAFLFDREKELLVIPILLAEIKGDKENLPPNTHGEFVYQGAYVYRITLDRGFELRGRITHYEDDEVFKKSGYYFRGDRSIQRSLYIDNILYTISQKMIKLNSLDDLSEIKKLDF